VRRHRLGRTNVEVTEVGFGGAQVGNLYSATSDEGATAAVDAAWEAGVRYFDTAPHYGLGLSERRLGKALAGRPRDEFVISTKVGRLLRPKKRPTGSDLNSGGFDVPDDLTRVFDYSRDGVRRSLEESLERLGLDRVDIVYVHDPDDHMDEAVSQALPALVELADEGVVGAVGAAMNFWQPLLRIVEGPGADAVMLAGRWTLLDRSGEPLLAECEARGVSVVAAAPFNSGLLSQPWPPDEAPFNYQSAPREVLERARKLAEVCQAHGTTLPEAAMCFPLRHPAVACVVSGMRTAGQAASAVRWARAAIGEETWAALDAVVAGWVPS
jgi:D-threo-aldose 1-dehydrogenase